MKLLSLLFLCLFCSSLLAQQPPSTSATDRLNAYEQRSKLHDQSLVKKINFKSVGPSVFSGRVADIDVFPGDPSIFYVGYASGGVWKTENNGTTFEPLFDDEAVMTIGDIAVDWQRNTIWVGTGEVNSSRSSYSGLGMYRSDDGGKTWQHRGLSESHHIGRVILHPDDPNTLWVAALGHLYSPNEERGIYKTKDGGTTWTKTLYVNENAGAVDLMIDPYDSNVLYASTWHRERRAWNFVESGEGSGIYRSADGGESWELITKKESGFPTGQGGGRIGMALGKINEKPILFSIVDNYNRRPKEKKEKDKQLKKEDFAEMSQDAFLALDDKRLEKYLRKNNFPAKYKAKSVKKMMKKQKMRPLDLKTYLEDANSLLFDTPVVGAEVYRSDDLGKSWKKTHEGYLDNLYNSYGYYFGQIRLDPNDIYKVYIFGVPILSSDNGGATFKSINGENVHADHHALWVNPARKGHLILGNDGGINISYDDGANWIKCNSPALGQFYAVNVDMAKPYNIYGGLQDNGVWVGSRNYKAGSRWHATGHYPYKELLGGDGMQIAVDTRDNTTVYTGFQFGNYFRINRKSGQRKYITPKHELGEAPLRWNWQTPVHLSIHNQDVLYMGSNKLHRSFDQGDHFKAISDDLTTGGIKGDVAYSTLSSIHESPLRFGLLYTGSDDGLIHVSQDGGYSWQKISEGLPKRMWVSRVQASMHEEGTVYAALNGYRWDDFSSYLYRSTDYGKNWQVIGTDLPAEPVNVVKEDPENANVLYVGTDHGLYVSINKGQTFMQMKNGLPAVAVHDLVIHPREKELIVATHGRSFYVANVAQLQQMNESLIKEDLHLFALKKKSFSSRWGESYSQWREAKSPEYRIPYYAKEAGELEVRIETKKGQLLRRLQAKCIVGLNYLTYNLAIDEKYKSVYEAALNKEKKKGEDVKLKKAKTGDYYLQKGTYTVILKKKGIEKKEEFVID